MAGSGAFGLPRRAGAIFGIGIGIGIAVESHDRFLPPIPDIDPDADSGA